MQTSYFAHSGVRKLIKKYPSRFISIACWTPRWWEGQERFLPLAPPRDLIRRYKSGEVSWEQYREEYQTRVLFWLDPQTIYDRFKGCILLCYEAPEKNCHRRIVAEWLEASLGVEVPEVPVK